MYACMSCLLAHKHPHVSAGLTKPVSHRCQGRASQSRRRPVSGVQIRCRHAENRRLCNRVHTGSNGYSHSYRAADSFTQNSQGLFASCSTIRMWAAVVVTLSRQTDMVVTTNERRSCPIYHPRGSHVHFGFALSRWILCAFMANDTRGVPDGPSWKHRTSTGTLTISATTLKHAVFLMTRDFSPNRSFAD